MAATLRYGSSGSDVKKLQEELNKNGYNLSVDGQFGSKTQSAVKSYQESKGLTVDGIVGTNTWGALNGGSSKKTTTTQNKQNTQSTQNANLQSTATVPQATRPTYKQGAMVSEAQKVLDDWESNKKPTDYTSPYADKINQQLDAILKGEKFNYDFNVDPIYRQMQDNFVKQGNLAMQNASAQAAALSGGYGSSYGTTAATQAYLQNMDELNDSALKLREQAYQAWIGQEEKKRQDLALLQQQEADAYGKHRDEVSDYNAERDYLYSKLTNEQNMDWSKYLQENSNFENDREYQEALRQYMEQFDYQKERDKIADDYQRERDKVADEQWQKSYELSKASKSSSGGSSSRSSGGSGDNDSSGTTTSKTTYSQQFNETRFDNSNTLFTDAEYKAFRRNVSMNRGKEGRCQLIEDAIVEGKITDAQANELLDAYGISDEEFAKIRGLS